jgi:hypothetical protein
MKNKSPIMRAVCHGCGPKRIAEGQVIDILKMPDQPFRLNDEGELVCGANGAHRVTYETAPPKKGERRGSH